MSAMEVAGLRVALRGTGVVLDGVDLTVAAGECVAVVGPSGAGKSVLARTLLGLTHGEPGAEVSATVLSIDGRDMRRASARRWRGLRGGEISLVLQDALQSLDPLRTVEAEVAEVLAVHGVPRAERRARVLRALADAELPDPQVRLRQRPGELSGGMRQRVLIAAALVGGAQVLVADEPTTALDATVAARVLGLLSRLRDDGQGILLVTHDLEAVRRVADRVVVLDRGRVVEAGTVDAIWRAPRHPVTRGLRDAVPRGAKTSPVPAPSGPVLARGVGLTRRYALPGGARVTAVDDVDITVHREEVVGIVGESGSGKSTLARLLVGAEQPDAGTLGTSVPGRVRLIPQDPLGSFDPRWNVERILRTAAGASGPSPGELLAGVGLEAAVLRRAPALLSGGQRQRVAIARALAARPRLLVCDEPVSALDVTTQRDILDLLLELQRREGLAMVFISHDLAVVRQVSDRILVMQAGQVVERGTTEQVLAAPADPFTRELIAASPPM